MQDPSNRGLVPSAVPSLPAGEARRLLAGFPRRVHLLGAGGAGVSAVARLLVDHGHSVSGHDRAESEHTARLREMGVALEVSPQEAARLPDDAELVIRSAAVSLEDASVRAALERNTTVLKYAEALARVAPIGRTLAIAGTHGKTTTSWMTYYALRGMFEAVLAREGAAAKLLPGAIIGGACRKLRTNAVTPASAGWFAVEACEYDRSFLSLTPQAAVITNIEEDHLDYYGTLEAIKGAFMRFADRVAPSGVLVLGRDVPRGMGTAARCPVWRLGREFKVQLVGERAGCFSFKLEGPGFATGVIELDAPGHFNVDNAACAIAVAIASAAKAYGLTPQEAAEAAARGVASYGGAERRFEPWGTVGGTVGGQVGGEVGGEAAGAVVIHDYAHHPTEVRVTLETARRAFPGRALHVLFQPHQHSRTAHFLADFAESLRMADRVVIADVYGARAHIDGEHMAGAPELVERLQALGVVAVAGGEARAAAHAAVEGIVSPSALLVLGAGDIVHVQHDLLADLADRGAVQRGSRR
jgi:UDP-N-acetylmuramate--alanine ligase